MKSNYPTLQNLRRLSSDHPNENHFINTLVSPQSKLSNFMKTPNDSSNKKHPGSSLRGILSPTNHQQHLENPKGSNSGKIEEDNSRNSLKNSERKPSAITINHHDIDIVTQNKKKSFDSQRENAQPEDHPAPKGKHMNSGSMSHFRAHNPSDLYLKDVDYVINPMFSPLNGPPKMSPVNGPPKLSPKADGMISASSKHVRKPSTFMMEQANLLGKRNFQVPVVETHHNIQGSTASKAKQGGHSKKPSTAVVHQKMREPKGFGGTSEERIHDTKIIHSQKRNIYDHQKTEKKAHNKVLSPRLTDSTRTTHGHPLNSAKNVKNIYHNTHRVSAGGENRDASSSNQHQNVYSQKPKESSEYTKAKNTLRGTVKREPGMKDTKRDFNFFQRVKDLEVLQNQIRNRASESDIKIDSATSHNRPKSSKHSDSHLYKDINSSVFSAFNNQLKRNSAAQIYNSISLFENYIQSTRSAVDQSEHHYFNKWSTHDSQNNLGNIIHEAAAMNFMTSPTNKENIPIASGGGSDPIVILETEAQQQNTKSSNIDDIVHELTKNNHLTQLKNNPNAKFLLLRKQVHDKRSNRGFKSDGQNLYDFHHKPIELRETDDTQKGLSTLKYGNATTEIHTLLPDTTGNSTMNKHGGNQLNDIQMRVKKVLDVHRYKEKLWENERRELLAEIQSLKAENHELGGERGVVGRLKHNCYCSNSNSGPNSGSGSGFKNKI